MAAALLVAHCPPDAIQVAPLQYQRARLFVSKEKDIERTNQME